MKVYVKPAVLRRDNLSAMTRINLSLENVEVSDARLKTDIARVGTTDMGLGLYTWRYHGQPEIWEGVLAQDVMRSRPDAIVTQENGFYAVDYGRLGLHMRRIS